MEYSANGWLASKDPNEIHIRGFAIKGTDIRIRCAESCGLVLAAFASEFHHLVEPINVGTYDDWGYAYRPIRGETTGLSNHSSGSAIDLNSVHHPLGKEKTFKPEQVTIIHELTNKYHLRWGGDYKTRKDEMHFEIVQTPEQVKVLIKQLAL